jgi:hypothetical protein
MEGQGGAKGGAIGSQDDTDLVFVVSNWPRLSQAVKAQILALVR